MRLLLATLVRELRLALRNPSDMLNPLVFFVMVLTLFPLGIGVDKELLARMAGGLIWVTALLSTLLGAETLFRSDHEDGSLEQMVLASEPLLLIVYGKVIAGWLLSGLLLSLLGPVFAYMLYVAPGVAWAVFLSLLLGTPVLSLLGAIGAALTVSLRKGGVLVAILVLPLYIPVLIIGTAMIGNAGIGASFSGHILWLGAMLALALGLAPIATAAALRISTEG